MIRLRGGRLVLPDRILDGAALAIDDGRIVEIAADSGASGDDVSCAGRWILPGFIDGHIHGVDGTDVLGGAEAVARVAAALPRHGVTAFCPTTIACAPAALERFLTAVDAAVAAATGRRGARARRAPREQLPQSRLQRRAAGGVPAAAAAARGARAPRRRLHRRRHRRRDRRASTVGASGHAGPRTRRRARPHRPRWSRPATGCRSGTRPPPSSRPKRPSPPARATPRICSTACRRWPIGRPGSPARCSPTTR